MRKLSIRKKVNILTAAIAIIAFVAVLFALALTLPSVAVDIKAESADNNASSETNLPSTISTTVTESGGDTKLDILGADEVEGLEDGSLPISQTQYIAAKGYEGNGSWTAITNAQQLLDWLVNKNGAQSQNAYLVANIENFSYGTGANAIATGVINVGKILDGCGYRIDVVVSGSNPNKEMGGGEEMGFFADKVYGIIRNVKFTFKLTATEKFKFWGTHGASFYPALLIGAVGTTSASDAMAVVENSSLEILPFASGGYIDWGFNGGKNFWNSDGYLRAGGMVASVRNGCVRNCTLIQTGGEIAYEGYGNGKQALSDSGTMIGIVGWDTAYTSYVYNLSVKGNGTKYTKLSGNTCRVGGAIGIFYDGKNSAVSGIYVESDLNRSGIDDVQRFVGQPNGMLTQYNQSLYSKAAGTKGDEAFFRLDANQEVRFAKPNPLEETMSLKDYQDACTKIIINDTSSQDAGKILWRVNRSSSATIDTNVFDQYQTYELMQPAGASTYIALSTKATGAANGIGGNRIQFIYGDKVTLSEIPSKTATYNGTAQTTTPVFRYANNEVFNADVSKYNVLYNNSTNQPILPSSAAYNVTIRGVEDANYAYFDSTNRVIALINDAVTATINIDYADISVTSVMCDGKVLDPSKYVNKPINYTVGFTTGVTVPTSGFRIEYRESTAMGWSDSQSGLTASITPMDGYNTGDKTYRFRVLAQNAGGQWVEVSNPTTEEMTFKYDDFVPETQYISTYVDGTWHTAASDVIINPKPIIRYSPATVQVRYVDSAGNPVNGADGQWHKADETFLNDEGYWVDGFKISTEGKTYFQLKAMSETGAEGVEQSYEVWIDRTTYKIDYEVSFVSGTGLTKESIILTGKTEIKRDEKPKLTLNTIDNGALSYYIAEVNGTAYSNEMEATYDYSVPKDMAIGGTPEIIKIKVRKGVKLTFTTPSSVIYGEKINLPTPNADGLVNGDTFDKLGVTVDFVSNEVTGGKAKAVGKHEFTASISNGDYLAIVENSNIEVTPRELTLDLNAKGYRFVREVFLGYGENAWKEFGLTIKNPEQILKDDTVNIAGVTYDKEIDAYGAYTFLGTLDNENYILKEEKGVLVVSMLEYNYSALNGEGAYELRTLSDFEAINDFPDMLEQNFVLMNDIDLVALADAAIKGTFKGTFDGNNHKLYNLLMVNYGLENYGLFYKIDGGTVKNLVIDNMSIGIFTTSKTESSVGLLAGEICGAIIDNVTIRGEIRVTDESALLNIGGIAGKAITTKISNVAYIATIEVYSTGKVMYGGVVGDANNIEIQNVEYIGIATVKSNVTESSVGYVTASSDTNSTINNINYINKSIGFNGARVDDVTVGTSVVYSDLANSTNLYAGVEYGTMLKQCIDPRYFGENVYGTGLDDAFVITNYNQLVATVIYPYATFKLANNIICHTVNMYDPSNFFGTLDMNGFIITDISGKEIQHA